MFIIAYIMKRYKKMINCYSRDELMVFAIVFSAFLSVYAVMACALFVFLHLVYQKRLSLLLRQYSCSKYLLAFCALSFLVSLVYGNLQGTLIALGMCLIFIISLFMRRVMTKWLFEKSIDLACFASLICFAIALSQHFLMASDPEYRATSTMMNANYYAAVIEIIILMCVYRLLGKRLDKTRRWFYCLVIAANAGGLLLCGCRTTMITVLAVVPVFMLFHKRYRLFAYYMAISLSLVIAFLCIPGLFPRGGDMGEDLGTRVFIWQTALKGFVTHPLFGQGGNTYAQIYASYHGYAAPHAHNILLDPLLNFGLVGVALLIPFLLSYIRSVFHLYRTEQQSGLFMLCVGVTLAILLHGITDVTVFWPQTGLLIAFVYSATGIYEKSPDIQYELRHRIVLRRRIIQGCRTISRSYCAIEMKLPSATLVIQSTQLWLSASKALGQVITDDYRRRHPSFLSTSICDKRRSIRTHHPTKIAQ